MFFKSVILFTQSVWIFVSNMFGIMCIDIFYFLFVVLFQLSSEHSEKDLSEIGSRESYADEAGQNETEDLDDQSETSGPSTCMVILMFLFWS